MASLIHTNLKQSYLEQPRDRLFAFQKHQEQARRPPPPPPPTMDPRSPPAPAAGLRVYEDVEPPHRWESGKDADVLVVDLTGFKGEDAFKKEHLKVRIDNYGNLKVSGERPLAGGRGDRWRRFQRVHRMADDCNPSEIKAKFDSGSLSVVMPKLIKTQPPAPAPAPSAPPPVKPEEKAAAAAPGAEVAASASRKAGEPGEARTDTRQERAKPEAGNGRKGAEKPDQPWSPRPLAKREEPKQGKAGLEEKEKRRRSRWVVVAVAAAMVVVLVGLGIYLRRRMMSGPDEPPESFTDLLRATHPIDE